MQIKSFLQQQRIQTRRDLRTLLSDQSLQGRLSLSKDDSIQLAAFENLSRVFGGRLAEALSPYFESLDTLIKMPSAKLKKRLVTAALSDRNQKTFHYRLERIRSAVKAGTPLSELSEITIAPGRKTDLSAADRKKIAKAEIFTFDDWLLSRNQVKVSKKTGQVLDAYARLSQIGATGEFAEALIQAGITSPMDYLDDPKKWVKALIKKLKIDSQEAKAYRLRAATYQSALADSVLASLIHRDESEPSIASVGQGKTSKSCTSCSPEETVFSRYAYFVHLVQKTGRTLNELDGILFQDFMNLSAADGLKESRGPQIDIVIRVLKKALPGEPDHADQWRYRRALLKAQLSLIPTSYGRFLQTTAWRLGYSGSALIDLGLRFEQLLGTGMESQDPFFDLQEYSAMSVLFDEMYIVRQLEFIDMTPSQFVAAAVQLDSSLNALNLESRLNEAATNNYRPDAETFSAQERLALQTIADQHLNTDGFHQLVDPIRNARDDALPALRDAYKAQSGMSDWDLFNRFFIEVNLPACETITPLGQAIRSLQAYLDHLAAIATDSQERDSFGYLDYRPWRSAVIAQFYPELDTLWKDGALTGATDFFDRGSIFLNRHGRLGPLRAQLATVREIIDVVRVNSGRDITFFQQKPEEIDKAAHTRLFSSTPQYPMFLKGLEMISAIIDADDIIQQGLQELDADEPGLAVDRYRAALSRLEEVADYLFGPETIWDFDGYRGEAVYQKFRKMHPNQRNLQYILLHSLLLGDSKALFTDHTLPNVGSFTIDPDQWAFPPPGAFGLNANDHIKHGRFEQDYQVEHRCYFEGGGNYTDYEFFAFVTLGRGGQRLSLSIGEELGVGVRMQDHLTDRRGYAAIVVTKSVGSENGGTIEQDFLQIVKKLQGSGQAILWESDDEVILANGEAYRIALRCRNRIESGGITGVELKARMTGPGTSTESPWIVDDQPITSGTFGLYCSAQIDAAFRPHVSFDSPQQTTAPPFFAWRRHSLADRNLLQDGNSLFQNHMNDGAPVAVDPASIELMRNNAFSQFEQLHGLKTLSGNQGVDQFLLFHRGEDTLSLDGLDRLLEYCLMLSFHLRFAVLPLRFSQAYLQAGDFASAAGYLQLIYDDTADTAGSAYDSRKVLPYLHVPLSGPAATESVDIKMMRLRIGEVYLEWADWLFRQNTDESKYEARKLYERVLALHGDTDYCGCFPSIGEAFQSVNVFPIQTAPNTDIDDGNTNLVELVNRYDDLVARGIGLRDYLQRRPANSDASDQGRSTAEELQRLDRAIAAANQRLREERHLESIERSSKGLLRSLEMELLVLRPNAFFSSPTTSLEIVGGTILIPAFWIITFCIPENPIRERQRRHACHMLNLLLSCRNILGFPEDAVPTLRFEALLELAQTQVIHARAAERDLLQFRQQYESETFSEREAANNVILTGAELTFEDLNVSQAVGDVQVATLQRNQAYHAVSHFETLIREGWTPAEYLAFGSSSAASAAALISVLPALAAVGIGLTGGILSLIGGVTTAGTGVGVPAGIGLIAGGVMSLGSGFAAVASAGGSISSALGSVSSTASMYASFERRDQEWRYQLGQNRFGLSIASAQLDQSLGRVDIARQRRLIASLRHEFAGDTLAFLQNRFLNAAMWLWMQKEIREQYRTRLHYATTAAYMAEMALRFELQDDTIRAVGFDYFDPKQDGLLGATKLETDIATLRQLKAQGEQRKLQVTKVLSLARIMPVEFERFRRTGSLPFRTLNHWFDEDFPGHYLRLIKAVRVSVMALTPPIGGIRATLRSTGLSSTVIDTGIPGDHQFVEKTIRREPQKISFSSPIGATGLFQLSAGDNLLLPFEGLGVETDWVLEMPRSTNTFDTVTLADVIIEIDYTALESRRYRQIVKERLGSQRRFDLSMSAKLFFPDEWYHFIHSSPDSDRILTFELDNAFIPVNIKPDTAIAYHLSMMVTGEWSPTEVDALKSFFHLQKEGLTWTGSTSPAAGEVVFETIDVEANSLVYSTRPSGVQNGQTVLGNVLAAGQWHVRASAGIDSLTDDGTDLLTRIRDILITISVEGDVLN